ncbi:hypothetical protein MKX01_041173 [Papaver californicum]|nr:hypothetical protein MKX01_041173 [Papaver californicum]
MVDALSSVRWKRHQDALLELSEHGIVLIAEDSGCIQAKVYLKRELFLSYDYKAEGRPRFGVGLGLFADCLSTFSLPGHLNTIKIRYPGYDMQLIFKIPETISWDYNFEPAGSTPLSFTLSLQL